MKPIYQKYAIGHERKTFSLRPETVEGLERIRKLFGSKHKEPTSSLILDDVLSKRIEAYESDPSLLEDDVADFQRRYGSK